MFHFLRGIRASRIFFDSRDDRWTLESLKSPGRRSKLSKGASGVGYPIGRQTWTVEVEQFVITYKMLK